MLLTGSIFLIPNGTFIVELVLFVIVLAIVGTFVLPPIRRTLEERERIVRSSLQAGEEGRVEADRLVAERDAVLARARAEARARFDEVAQANEERRSEARGRAEQERARLVADAAGQLEAERRRARLEVMGDVGALVVRAAEQVLGRPVDPSRHQALLGEVARAAAGEASAGGGR